MSRMGSASSRFDGFFKSEFKVNETIGRSVSYVRDGKLLGGNSGFAHIGSYSFDGDTIAVEVTSRRHNFGAAHQSLLGQDIASIQVKGQAVGAAFHFEGGSPQMPTAVFRSVMTPLDESELAPPGTVAEDGISNGLYSIHLKVLDGTGRRVDRSSCCSKDGRIFGGVCLGLYAGPRTRTGLNARRKCRNTSSSPPRRMAR